MQGCRGFPVRQGLPRNRAGVGMSLALPKAARSRDVSPELAAPPLATGDNMHVVAPARRLRTAREPPPDTTALGDACQGGKMDFWTDQQLASIDKMLNPRSIAIVGATPRMQYGGRVLAAALKGQERIRGYAGNPRYDEIMGEKSYPSVTDLPEAPDTVAVVVRYDQVLDVLRESHAKGAGSAIVISAGFAERGEGDRRDLQGELGAFARASGLRISGPNCLGLANVKQNIWATASSRGAEGLTGPIGLVCPSGATAFGPFLVRAVENGIGFSYIISTGNEADLDFTDFARYLLDDPDTRVI